VALGIPRPVETLAAIVFAIDEAHCISEWGNEVGRSTARLSNLRELFPDHPIAAFHELAPRHGRNDIIEQLRSRDPHKTLALSPAQPRLLVREPIAHARKTTCNCGCAPDSEGSVIIYASTICS